MQVGEAEVLAAAEVLRTALQRRDGIESRIRSGDLSRDLLDRSLDSAESVLAARATFYRLLKAAGWTAPSHVIHDLEVDARVLRLDA